MIGISAIGTYIPPGYEDNLARAEGFDTDEQFVIEKLGFLKLRRKAAELETSDLSINAFNDLAAQRDILLEKIDCLVVCTQTPDNAGLPHTSSVVHAKLGLSENVAVFDISLGCSGYVYGIGIVKAFMEANGLKNGLFFTADPYSKILDSSDRDTELLFGDAATCTLMTADAKYKIERSVYSSDGTGREAIRIDQNTGKLVMQGKDVFMFAMKKVPRQIKECLKRNSLEEDEIDLFILHQGSKYIVDNLRKQLRLPEEKVPFLAHEAGNTVSSSIPLILKQELEKGHGTILLSGFGVGLSWATTILHSTQWK